jgi:hypothetical protein
MEILINDESLDFTLEKEKNLGDIIKGLEECVLKNGNVIESITVDNRIVPFDYGSADFHENISGINQLKIIVQSQVELAVSTLITVGEYIYKIQDEYTKQQCIECHEVILEGLKLIHEGIIDSLRMLHIKSMFVIKDKDRTLLDILVKFNKLIIKYEKRYLDEQGKKSLTDLLDEVVHILPRIFQWAVIKNHETFKDFERLNAISYLKIIFSDLLSICSQSVNKFEEIGKNLQLGEDRLAFNDLYYLTELFDEIITILNFGKNTEFFDRILTLQHRDEFERLFRQIMDRLKKTEKAFKDGDMITLGDVFEYEIKPLFENLLLLMRKIKI